MLGYNKGYSIAMVYSSFGSLEYQNFAMSNVACKGSESSIQQCGNRISRQCQRSEAAGVKCDYVPKGIIKLVGGSSSNQGNVMLDGKPVW